MRNLDEIIAGLPLDRQVKVHDRCRQLIHDMAVEGDDFDKDAEIARLKAELDNMAERCTALQIDNERLRAALEDIKLAPVRHLLPDDL